MWTVRTGLVVFTLATLCVPAVAGLSPQDVVVVYNNSTLANDAYDWSVSKAVADYCCAARNIPSENEVGVTFPYADEGHEARAIPRPHSHSPPHLPLLPVPASPSPIRSDPTKCIVLCYGIPSQITGNERCCSVDSALTLLFNSTDWGRTPIGSYCSGALTNPYYSPASTNPLDRGGKPADFGEFRANETLNDISVAAPIFTIIRAFDDTHAIAAGTEGVLYTGTRTGNSWDWNPVDDSSKSFVAATINDISVFDSSHAWACTAFGSVIATNNGGENWTVVRNGTCDPDSNDCVTGVSLYSQTSGWYSRLHISLVRQHGLLHKPGQQH